VTVNVWFIRFWKHTYDGNIADYVLSGSTLEDYIQGYMDLQSIPNWCKVVLL
jgi:hypothetical protein